MGYTTDFEGKFKINKKLDPKTKELLIGLATTRRMKRAGLDPIYGIDGEFYCPKDDNFGQDDRTNVVDPNTPPRTQPSLWCQWIVNDAGTEIEWDGVEKFYDYIDWIKYLIERVLKPAGYSLTGEVEWQGEDREDRGKIKITKNKVKILQARVIYE